jgi:hypothetical protein
VLFTFVPSGEYTPADIENYQLVAQVDAGEYVDDEVLADEPVGSELPSPITVDPASVSLRRTERSQVVGTMAVSNNTGVDLGARVGLYVNGGVATFPVEPIPAGSQRVRVESVGENVFSTEAPIFGGIESISVFSGATGVLVLDDES